ncbi:Protein transport protein Sec61 subunit beta [Sparganum proliferum]
MTNQSGGSKASLSSGPAARGGGTRQRKSTGTTSRRPLTVSTPKSPVFLFYSEDSPGIKCLCFCSIFGAGIPRALDLL